MPQDNVRPKYLAGEEAIRCAAKIRCLDHFLAQQPSETATSDYDFVASMKDWVDQKHAPISSRQEWRVNKIWDFITDRVELEYESFVRPEHTAKKEEKQA